MIYFFCGLALGTVLTTGLLWQIYEEVRRG